MGKWFDEPNIAPRNNADAKKLMGKRVKFVRPSDVDNNRGMYFPRYGKVEGAHGRSIIIDGNYYGLRDIIEMVEITK